LRPWSLSMPSGPVERWSIIAVRAVLRRRSPGCSQRNWSSGSD
jgi:hypothetical protein